MKKRSSPIELNFGELPTLPSGWQWGQMANVATDERNSIVDGPFGSNLKLNDYIDPPGVPVLTTANLRGDYGPSSVRYISQSKFNQLKRSEVRGGDILVAKIGSCGLTGIYPEDMPSAIIPANLLKITVHKDYSRKFIFHYLNSPVFSEFLKKIITATAQPAFNVTKFRMLPMPLVCKQTQDTIVAELEKQLTRLEAGVAALKRVQANLKRYRAAILKAACEGRLVPTEADLARKEGRSYETGDQLLARILTERRQKWQGRGKYKEPAAPETANLQSLPEGWTRTGFEQLSDGTRHAIKAGPFGSTLKKSFYVATGFKIYGQEQVINGDPYFGDYFISPELFNELKSCAVKPGDILISLVGTAGKVLILPEDCVPGIINPRLLKLSLNRTGVSTKFIKIVMESAQTRAFFKLAAHGGTMEILNFGILKSLPLPLPPLAEQKRIVAEVERRLSVVEEQEAVVAANLQRGNRLRQAILQRAFSGGLVYNGT
ncbi:MAG: restriction endonuclease subunit S [Proteobacteria bacterium]|nr:restriction endonuclease subunit S [Pseudomonadota bacterium]MBU2227325.1 restriction endonuclease subunit S [Pseudomonadota bacterium]MBU2261296.1 restriction endonuclease subunit S [Pseudomonadota bacterium]